MWDTKAKTNRKMWLICAAHDTNMNMKAVEKALGAGNGKLRGAGTDFMERILGVLPGAVNLFSILNDTNHQPEGLITSLLPYPRIGDEKYFFFEK